MYPAAFEYVAPRSLDEVLAELAERGDEARILAGGMSLVPMMKLRLAYPEALVDINNVPGLDGIGRDDGALRIGALVRHGDVDDASAGAVPLVAATAPQVADPLIRNRGTVCGSVAHCDPEGDWNAVMLATGAEIVARSVRGERTVPIGGFIDGPFENALDDDEMVVAVRVPVPTGPAGGAYLKLKRKIGDYATVGVAAHLELGDAGRVAASGVALTAVTPVNSAVEAAADLVGEEPTDEAFAEIAEAAARACDPHDDVRGPAAYKRDVVRTYVRRGLAQALAQARST